MWYSKSEHYLFIVDIGNIGKILTIESFKVIGSNPKIGMGYYSYKIKDYKCEICIDFSFRDGWQVTISNKFEEVIECYKAINERQCVIIANKICSNLYGSALLL